MSHAGQACLRSQRHHAADRDFHGDVNRNDVQAVHHRIAQRHRLH